MSAQEARKRFGQNFLHDRNIIARIIDVMAPAETDHFVEIGPGHGAITRPLSERVRQLDIIEIDRDLAAELESQSWPDGAHLHCADALRFDFGELASAPRTLRLAGNLPYNISTPLLFHLLDAQHLFRDMHVMLQKEVIQRMTAQPGSKVYGRLTVALAARCEVQSLFGNGAGAFRPAPKVESAFARLTPLDKPLLNAGEEAMFDRVLRHAFGQRRKQLGNALRDVISTEQFSAAGVDPQARAETLEVDEFVALTRAALR